jgi:valyl-tRNA synthetase
VIRPWRSTRKTNATAISSGGGVVPILGREIPVIADEYVDREFGTGALKITPGHDPNDYEIGQRHNLEIINCPGRSGAGQR